VAKSRTGAALVAAILLIALVARLAYVDQASYRAINDAGSYNRLGGMVARTGDYDVGGGPGSAAGGARGATAYFPPGFPYFLGAVDLIDGHTAGGKAAVPPARIAMAVVGTVAVTLVGLVALEAFGDSIALVCMALAALYPVLVELSGTLVAENLLLVFELAAIWTALRARRSSRPYAWIAATGVLSGLGALTHENAIVFVIPLAFAAAAATRSVRSAARPTGRYGTVSVLSGGAHGTGSRRRDAGGTRRASPAAAVGVLIAAVVLTIAPWTIRNAVELHHFVPISDETGITLAGTYNPASAANARVPYKWRFFWAIPQDAGLRRHVGNYTEPALSSKLESQALDYVGAHPLSPLSVAYHNTLRMFEVEGTFAWHASADAIGLSVGAAGVGVAAFWLVCILALAGILTRAARGAPRWLWAMPVLYALTIVFVNVETPRFREPIDPFLLLLAGCAIEAALQRLGVFRAIGWQRWRPAFDA
jgi:hypothetical protein